MMHGSNMGKFHSPVSQGPPELKDFHNPVLAVLLYPAVTLWLHLRMLKRLHPNI
jgi:hypothetical protein